MSQWDELNSKKTAGEAAAYLSEYFEVAKGNSKNPNIVEARREEGARRAKMAEAMYANDYDEFGQNKRRVSKAEEEMIKSGSKVLPGSTYTKPIIYDPAVLEQEHDNAEAKKEKDKYTKLLEKPIKEWSTADRILALAKDSPLSEERGRVTLFDYIGDAPRILKKEVALKDDSKQDWDASSKTPEEGLTHANLDWVPAGKVLENIVTIGGKSIAPAIKSILSGPDIEALKRANDFNKIGIWRELRSRGLEVTDDMVNEILRQGKVLPR